MAAAIVNTSSRLTNVQSLQSTPSNDRGSASRTAAGHYETLFHKEIAPWIYSDVYKASDITFDALLKHFLEVALLGQPDPEDASKDELFKKCLAAVLPLANDAVMRAKWEAYRTAKGEAQRYTPFVNANNHVLEKLKDLDAPYLGKGSEFDTLFHQCDPDVLIGEHDGLRSHRKPDVIQTSLAAVRLAQEEPLMSWQNAKEKATSKPKTKFSWSGVMTAYELKAFDNDIKPLPKGNYDTSLHVTVPYIDRERIAIAKPSTAPAKPLDDPFTDQNAASGTGPQASSGKKRSKSKAKTGSHLRTATTSGGGRPNLRSGGPPDVPDPEDASPAASNPDDANPAAPEDTQPPDGKKMPDYDGPEKVPPVIQLASYASEMLCRAPVVNHCFNFLVVDDVIWIWYYDRQGVIQSTGLNFLQDLPRYLLLMLTLQRFRDLEDWGINMDFDPYAVKLHTGQFKDRKRADKFKEGDIVVTIPSASKKIKVKFNPKKDQQYGRLSLLGRGTRVFNVKSQSTCPDPDHKEKTLKLADENLVMKVYWPDKSRTSESDIVSTARSIVSEHQPDLLDNLPVIYHSYDYEGTDTSKIRVSLGLPIKTVKKIVTGRILRVLLMERLESMMTLQPQLFMSSWLQVVKCHYFVWECGVEHSDISEGNVMYRTKKKGNIIYGVLNDWDLATLRNKTDHGGLERTGTIPFMALDLLTEKYWKGKIKRLYRHDLESLVWLLPWVSLNYTSDGYRLNGQVKYWITGNYMACRKEKNDFLNSLSEFHIDGLWQDMRAIIGKPLGSWIEPGDQSLYLEVMDTVATAMARFPDISVPTSQVDIPVEYRLPPTPPPAPVTDNNAAPVVNSEQAVETTDKDTQDNLEGEDALRERGSPRMSPSRDSEAGLGMPIAALMNAMPPPETVTKGRGRKDKEGKAPQSDSDPRRTSRVRVQNSDYDAVPWLNNKTSST
ncbi:unnamed protein product [Somion occarium]|uniref:Fungal-type protein kinase domain-containing protein n=1 Tax=Somion occarium TaxID=3059160 RepID=A0ABP1E1E3_9APHY